MTIRDYLLSKPDSCTFEITYIFEFFCQDGKCIPTVDEEYSNCQTVGELRQNVADNDRESHYYGYNFVYDGFEIEDSDVEIEETAEEVSVTITVADTQGGTLCDDCLYKSFTEMSLLDEDDLPF